VRHVGHLSRVYEMKDKEIQIIFPEKERAFSFSSASRPNMQPKQLII